jgi:hypothetical protein
MAKAEHVRCAYCGKDLGHMAYEGQETWEHFCSKKHADLYDEGKISPKYKQNLSTAITGRY